MFFFRRFLLVDVIHTLLSALKSFTLINVLLNLLPSSMLTRRPSENQ